MKLGLIDNGEVIDTIEDIEDYQLQLGLVQRVLADRIEAMIKLALNKRELPID